MAKRAGIYLALIITAVFLVSGSLYALTGSGGGYYFIDSNEGDGPVFAWEDISATGTPFNLLDDDASAFPLPFDFVYNGITYTEGSNIYISSNGHIDFSQGDGNTTWNDLGNAIPSESHSTAFNTWGENPLIAPWFDDLTPYDLTRYGDVYYKISGTFPSRKLTVQWDAPHYDCKNTLPDDMLSIQAALFEGSGDILMLYDDATNTCPALSNGASATIGLAFSNTAGLQYAWNTPAIDDGLAVLFGLSLSLNPHFLDFGFVEKGTVGEETLTVTNRGTNPINISSIAQPDAPFSIAFQNCTGAPILAGESRTITVWFDPETALAEKSGVLFAGTGVAGGFIFFGIAFAGGAGRRRLAALIIAGTLFSGMLLASCGGGGGDTPPPGDIVYNQSFDITSDDPLRPTVTVNIRGSSR